MQLFQFHPTHTESEFGGEGIQNLYIFKLPYDTCYNQFVGQCLGVTTLNKNHPRAACSD